MNRHNLISRFAAVSALLLILNACSTGGSFSSPYATGYYASAPMQCVPYAREASGFQLYGDAHTWWNQANPPYMRQSYPVSGAVLVLASTPRMTHGHVAVVRRIIGPRDIDVTHSNWGNDRRTRSRVFDFVRVQDVSLGNDWSQVRFWNVDANSFGFPYPTMGFIVK